MNDMIKFLKYYFFDSFKELTGELLKGTFWHNMGLFMVVFVVVIKMPCKVILSDFWTYLLLIAGITMTVVGAMIKTFFSGIWRR